MLLVWEENMKRSAYFVPGSGISLFFPTTVTWHAETVQQLSNTKTPEPEFTRAQVEEMQV